MTKINNIFEQTNEGPEATRSQFCVRYNSIWRSKLNHFEIIS